MLPSATALATQQLAQFLAVISTVQDSAAATAMAAELAARALESEVGAVLGVDGVLSAVGYSRGTLPTAELAEIAAGARRQLDVPGAGRCHTAVAPIAGHVPGHLLVARSGDDEFTVDEVSLLRGMARVLELTIARLHTLDAERRQAAENERLLRELRDRHRLLEELSRIQRAIARQQPLQSILDAVTRGAQNLLGDERAELRMRDPDDPQMLVLHAHLGVPVELAKELWRLPVSAAGAAGQALLRDDVVVSEHPRTDPTGRCGPAAGGAGAAMAAPVHDDGTVVGSLLVASCRRRHYTDRDREVLRVFADQVSLAVTDHKIRERMSEAYHDSLTGLASRALFLEQLDYGLARARRQATQLAVLFLDLDRFKMVNDSLGHAAGDALLVVVADRLRQCLRASDRAARFGGDEFAVVLEDLERQEDAVTIARRIISVLQEPFLIQDKVVFVNASIGITFNVDAGTAGEDLMRTADLAMYQAKRNGKGRYEIFEPAMRAQLLSTLDTEAHLRRAVERHEFVLHYQPIVDLTDGRINGVEALLRWRHPERGILAPIHFVPLAEETGLIVPIGQWVLRMACREVAAWNAARHGKPPLAVNVNLSARQLQQADLPCILADVLGETALDPACLVLEITESLLLHDTEATMSRLGQIKALGLRLALDDFGTGYSSLAYLRRFPIDIIKIDKSFVGQIACGPEASRLARAIVQLGQTLELVTVAEGIESADQVAELRSAGCGFGQGYYFAKPLDRDEMDSLLSTG
jgi:diguanylate cyclase (GGDEF)-like protein